MTDSSLPAAAPATWREPLLAVFAWLERVPLWLFQFAFRLSVGGVFWHSGLTKIDSWQTTVVLFRDEYRVPLLSPEIAAVLATAVELTCPVLLLVGLGSRLATLPMLGMTLVIQLFVYPESWNAHLMWASMLLFILTRGPGVLSLDHLIARRLLS
jgi:putative oxidoreductase